MKYVMEGYFKFFSRQKNQTYFKIVVSRPATSEENSRGVFGKVVDMMFISEEIYNKLSPDQIGKSCNLIYEYNGFRPVLTGVTFVK